MPISRRTALGSLLAAPALLRGTSARAATRTLKISHQFPGGTLEQGDYRDRLVRRFAAAVQERTLGGLSFEIHPGATLMKPVPQFSAMSRGALDMSVFPLAYAGDEMPEARIALMPSVVTTYEQGMAWKTQPIGQELTKALDRRGIKIVTWIWQAGSTVSRTAPLVVPEELRGVTIRGGSHEMDLMLTASGANISKVLSNEIYSAMQGRSLDAAVTSSTTLISFKMPEVAKAVTVGGTGSFWFMFGPLLMSKQVYSSLPATHQKAIDDVGAEMDAFAIEAVQEDDERLSRVFADAGLAARDMDESAIDKWRALAEATAWKDFSARSAECAAILKLAQAVT